MPTLDAKWKKKVCFKYTKRNIDNNEVFVFIQTNELMKELNSKFEQGSFLLSSNVCF